MGPNTTPMILTKNHRISLRYQLQATPWIQLTWQLHNVSYSHYICHENYFSMLTTRKMNSEPRRQTTRYAEKESNE